MRLVFVVLSVAFVGCFPTEDPAVCVVGPLDGEGFAAKRAAMGVSPGLEFSVVF
ncbi:MAG TPA: hypothetical protein VF432_04115 [Thermoanaerobaculia bacterium]